MLRLNSFTAFNIGLIVALNSVVYCLINFSSRLIGVIVCLAFLLMSCIVSGTLSSVNNYPIGVFGGGGDPK